MPRFGSALHVAHLASAVTPASGHSALYPKTGDVWYSKNSGGTEEVLSVGPAPCRITSAVNNSTTTIADVTGLTLALQAGRYMFRFIGQYTTAAATTGLGLAVNGPTLGTDGLMANVMIATTNAVPWLGTITAYNTASLATASSGSTRMPWEVWGIVQVSAAGSLVLRNRSEVASSQVSIQAGSHGYAWRIS